MRDALLEEMRLKAKAEEAKVKRLKSVLEERDEALAESQADQKAKDAEIKDLRNRLGEAENHSQAIGQALSKLNEERSGLKIIVERMEEDKLNRKASSVYLVLLVIVLALSGVVGWLTGHFVPVTSNTFVKYTSCVFSGVCVFIILHGLLEMMLKRYDRLTRLWPFKQVSRFRGWLWTTLVFAFLINVAAGVYVNYIQNGKEESATKEQPAIIKVPDSNELLSGKGSNP